MIMFFNNIYKLVKNKKHMNKKGYTWLVIISAILLIGSYLLYLNNSKDTTEPNITGNVIKDLEDKIGFQGIRDPVDKDKSKITFRGGPGKTLKGNFNNFNVDLFIENGKIIGFEGTINADSVSTSIQKLTQDLKGEKMFNVNNYPNIKFKSSELSDNYLIGELTFKGITKDIKFPVNISDESISSDFLLDVKPFDLDSRTGKDVRIIFEFFK